MENRPADAVESYLTAVRVGQEGTRGGIMIDGMVRAAIEALGLAQLEKLGRTMDASTCRKAVAILEDIESRRETVEITLAQEHLWTRRAYGLRGQIVMLLLSSRKSEKGFISRANGQVKRAQSLMIDLAARAYELEHGQRATNISELVPTYLKTIPRNPITGTNSVLPGGS